MSTESWILIIGFVLIIYRIERLLMQFQQSNRHQIEIKNDLVAIYYGVTGQWLKQPESPLGHQQDAIERQAAEALAYSKHLDDQEETPFTFTETPKNTNDLYNKINDLPAAIVRAFKADELESHLRELINSKADKDKI